MPREMTGMTEQGHVCVGHIVRVCDQKGTRMAEPDFNITHYFNAGSVPHLDKLQSDTALLRRIAYSTDQARLYLGWLLAITMLGIIAAVFVGIVLIAHSPSSTPAACNPSVSTC
ncbi:MAG TPA: hypothetical protein VG247_32970 [Pseudonocardiaceae bacterium]|jgi:hypothetical protein|nr:hypothetical protein [Pseudonocardiaceae bacterium]